MNDDRIISELSDIDHVLLRPNQYIGSTKRRYIDTFIFNNTNKKFEYISIDYISGLIKIIMEIFDNSIDEAIKTDFKYSNIISININREYVEISDNGRGIPVIKNDDGIYMPKMAWTKLRTGSNFHDNNRKSRGMNGVGSSCTNIFSKKFIGITCDGKKKYKIECKNNISEIKEDVNNTRKKGTIVKFYPDLKRFNLEYIDDKHINMVKQIIINNSIIYPKIKFEFNGEKINYFKSFIDYAKCFSDNFVKYENDSFKSIIYLNDNDEFRYLTFINGLFMSNGGNHIEYILKNVLNELKTKLQDKIKNFNLKPLDLKNRLSFICFMNDFYNAEHSSQTKDSLENEDKDISEYLKCKNVDIKNIVEKLINDKYFINNIKEISNIKNEINKLKEIDKKDKINKKDIIYSSKYIPANSKNRSKCSLYICEGDSAKSQFLVSRKSTDFQAMFPIKGKIKNVRKCSMLDVYKNNELNEILKITGMSLTNMAVDFHWSNKFYKVFHPNEKIYILNENDKIKIDNEFVLVSNLDDDMKILTKLKNKEFSINNDLIKRNIKSINMNFGNGIKILADADYDGYSIVGLFINFFVIYFPELFEANLIKNVVSPIMIAYNKKHKYRFYNYNEFDEFRYKNNINEYNIEYYKGLGSLPKEEYSYIINNDELCQILEYKSDEDDEMIDVIYSEKKSGERKDWLMGLTNF